MSITRTLLLLFILFGLQTHAQGVLTENTRYDIFGKQVKYLIPEKELSVREALASNKYVLCDKEVPNIGFSDVGVWLQFSFKNESDMQRWLLDLAYPILDSVELYALDSNNAVESVALAGGNYIFDDRRYKFPSFIFDLNIPKGATRTFLMRVKSKEQIIAPLSVNKPRSLWERLGKENALIGIYVGIILIMAFYNLFLFFSVKDKGYLYYVGYVVFVGLTQLGIKGFNYQFLWPESPRFEQRSTIMFACLSCIATLHFSKHFLKIKETARRANIVLNFLYVLFITGTVLAALGFITPAFKTMLNATALETFVLFFVSMYVMRKGYEPAKYFVAAWSVLLVGSLIFLMKDFGVLPYNVFTSYAVQGASAIEMALLSFGLANSINILKKEKEMSQQAALEASLETARVISEQNTVLEVKVAERTEELQQTNENLNSTLDELKQAQSQLVESEKMASLGQLTAGIAHEINNPINFVTGNVAPLKRDVTMVLDTIDFIEKLAYEQIDPEEKRKRVEEYKEELDYDYLKMEITHLLNGIYEGSSRTAEIVKGLRIFSRVDENDLKRADVNEGLDSSLIIVNNMLNGDITVKKEFDPQLPAIECYPGKLNQVFLNIITNAIHAVKKQHGDAKTGEILIKTKADGENIQVIIADNGTGMDETTKHKIYEPFFTTKEVGEGTGLGMSIVYNTIKKHNGHIQLDSEPGMGATFTITLPVLHETVPASA